jgi:predicted O-linked N-acetylglucosamine transferase (SPINDLY family)
LQSETPGILSGCLESLAISNFIMTPSIVVKRSAYEKLGGFHLQLFHSCDWDMWKRIATNYPVWYEPQPLACYRQHSKSDTLRLMASGANIAEASIAIEVAESYLPRNVVAELSNEAREHHALYALDTAYKMFMYGNHAAALAQLREGMKCSQSPTVFKTVLAVVREVINKSNQSITARNLNLYKSKNSNLYSVNIPNLYELLPVNALTQFLTEFQLMVDLYSYADRYQQDPSDRIALANLQQFRKTIAQKFVDLPPAQLKSIYQGELGKAHKILLDSGIKDESSIDNTEEFVNQCKDLDRPEAINYLLAAMLYYRADRLPLPYDLTHIPHWLLRTYLKYIVQLPLSFQNTEELDKYYHYMQHWVDYIRRNVFNNRAIRQWQDIALVFSNHANFIPLCNTKFNLVDICSKRAELIEFSLRVLGHEIDRVFPVQNASKDKLRIGIVATRFNSQEETCAILPVFEHLDRNQFEIVLYALKMNRHTLEQYCQSRADKLVNLPNELFQQVQTIRADDLDLILFGNNISTENNDVTSLAVHRLARVQVASCSSPITTGIRNIDYYISGTLVEPVQDAQKQYSEQLVTLDGTGYCFNSQLQPAATAVPTRSSLGIDNSAVMFISCANLYKITPELKKTWSRIITSVPNSVLVLYPYISGRSHAAKTFKDSMQAIFKSYGIDTSRVVILDAVPNRADIEAYLKLGDVYLDSYPYSGFHSVLTSLAVSLPTIVMEGNSLRAKQGAALLQELQMLDLIAEDDKSYVELAIALGTNPELRQQTSERIHQRMQDKPKFIDSPSYSAQMGDILQKLILKYQANALTENFKLRETNLILFPDWSQPEDLLYQDLASVIASLMNHSDQNQMTLLIDRSTLSEDEATFFVSGVVMNLVMEEDLDVADGLEISFIGQLSETQWEVLSPCINARIVLEHENQQAIAQRQVEKIPTCKVSSVSELTSNLT